MLLNLNKSVALNGLKILIETNLNIITELVLWSKFID